MDVSGIISSISIIAIIAFVITFIVVLYEVFMVMRLEKKDSKVDVPAFTEIKFDGTTVTPAHTETNFFSALIKDKKFIAFLLLMIVFGVIAVGAMVYNSQVIKPTEQIDIVPVDINADPTQPVRNEPSPIESTEEVAQPSNTPIPVVTETSESVNDKGGEIASPSAMVTKPPLPKAGGLTQVFLSVGLAFTLILVAFAI